MPILDVLSGSESLRLSGLLKLLWNTCQSFGDSVWGECELFGLCSAEQGWKRSSFNVCPRNAVAAKAFFIFCGPAAALEMGATNPLSRYISIESGVCWPQALFDQVRSVPSGCSFFSGLWSIKVGLNSASIFHPWSLPSSAFLPPLHRPALPGNDRMQSLFLYLSLCFSWCQLILGAAVTKTTANKNATTGLYGSRFVIYDDGVSGASTPPSSSKLNGFNTYILAFYQSNGVQDKAALFSFVSDVLCSLRFCTGCSMGSSFVQSESRHQEGLR
jgi:hypothetical protein